MIVIVCALVSAHTLALPLEHHSPTHVKLRKQLVLVASPSHLLTRGLTCFCHVSCSVVWAMSL